MQQGRDEAQLRRKWQHRMMEEIEGTAAMEAKVKRYGALDEPFYR